MRRSNRIDFVIVMNSERIWYYSKAKDTDQGLVQI